MVIHSMKLHPAPFDKIKSGEKIYELRLYDEKRKDIRVGDMIEFIKTDGSEMLTAEVLGLITFNSFAELYSSLPLDKCGYSADEIDKADPADMEQYYSKEQQKKYGVVAIKIKVTEKNMLDYKIVKKAQFSVMGVVRGFNIKTSQTEVPKFWQEHMSGPAIKDIWGTYGICLDDTPDFEYMIADDYAPWKDMPDGAQVKVIPAGTWAVFPCRGALPHSIQNLSKRIYSEWLPSNGEYKKAGPVEIEYYPQPCNNTDEDYCEIWVQVEKI